jgi:endonuclease G
MVDEREILRESARRILEHDETLAAQLDILRGLAGHEELRPTLEGVRDRVGTLESMGTDSALALETIVNRVGRPVLEVSNDDYVVEGPEAAVWEARLGNATVRAALRRVIPSVGRIEVDNHPDLTWVGTGWLIADDVVVTNRHVASEFAALSLTAAGRSFVFKRGWPDRESRMAARVDFRRELRNVNPRAFSVREVLHIEDDDGPDFAFLRVERAGASGPLSPSLRAGKSAEAQEYVATIGYPAADSRLPEQDLMSRLFGDKYNVKRLAPGQVMRLGDDLVMHDCSTLGGNSGSPIVDLATGDVLGLHFSGLFLRENRGVPIGYVTSRLQKVLSPGRPTPEAKEDGMPQPPSPVPVPAPTVSAGALATMTIPLQISVTFGTAIVAAVSAPTPADPSSTANPVPATVGQVRERLKDSGEFLTVRDGLTFRNG